MAVAGSVTRRTFLVGSCGLGGSLCLADLANLEKRFGMNGLNNTAHSIIWRQLDNSSMEHCTLAADSRHVHLNGIVTASANAVPWRIEYEVVCDPAWAIRDAHVRAVAGGKTHDVSLRADGRGHWWVNGERRADLDGCIDVDFGFTPST